MDGGDVHGGFAHHRMAIHTAMMLPRKVVEPLDDLAHFQNRVVTLFRHGGVGGLAEGFDFHPEQTFVADIRIVGGGLGHHNGTGTIQQFFIGQKFGTLAADFLGGGQHQRDTRRIFQHGCQANGRHHKRGDAAFHVGGTAAIELIAVGLAGKRITLPGLGTQRHDVDVAGETNWWLFLSPANGGNHAGAGGGKFVILHLKARVRQQLAQKMRAIPLLAGRIDGVEMQ